VTELIRFGLLGREDVKVGTGTFTVQLADGREVVLSALDVGAILSNPALYSTITSALKGLILESFALADLPLAGTAGRLARVTDDNRGLRTDTGTIWSAKGRIFYAEDFDISPDRTAAQNDTGFTALLTALPATDGGRIILPPGRINFSSTITIRNPSIILQGAGDGVVANRGTELFWQGVAGSSLLVLRSGAGNVPRQERSIVQNLVLNGNSVATTTGLELNPDNTETQIETLIRDVVIKNVTTGVALGPTTGNAQTSEIVFRRVYIFTTTTAALFRGTLTNVIKLYDSAFADFTSRGLDLRGPGPVYFYGHSSTTSSAGTTDIFINSLTTGDLAEFGTFRESGNTHLAFDAASGAYNVLLVGSQMTGMAANGINFNKDGHLAIIGGAYSSSADPGISVTDGRFSTHGANFGNTFGFISVGAGAMVTGEFVNSVRTGAEVFVNVPRFSITTPAQIIANQVAYDGGMFGVWRISSDIAGRSIQGILAGREGAGLRLINVGANSINLTNEDAGAPVAADRVITGTGATIAIAADDTVELIYDATTARWRVTNTH